MRAGECYRKSNVAAGTYGPFTLMGGKYQIAVVATGTISVKLNILGPDGLTYLLAITEITANGFANYDLPPGTYQIVIATSTANYVTVTRIPLE